MTTRPDESTDPETPPAGAANAAPEVAGNQPPEPEPDSFPRQYVEDLRRESAGYRDRAKRADALAERLLVATVREATAGILADPTDLDVSEPGHLLDADGYPDPEAITAAARALVERKPHLSDRRPAGDIGQGATVTTDAVDLAAILRGRA